MSRFHTVHVTSTQGRQQENQGNDNLDVQITVTFSPYGNGTDAKQTYTMTTESW